MQLRIQRSQRAGGVLGNTVFFCLDVRADYAPEEQANVRKYKLGGQVIYNSQAARKHMERANAHLDRVDSDSLREKAAGLARGSLSAVMARLSLNISIASLGRGHHIECKDLEELLEAEDTVRNACKGVTRYLEVAATFNGSEVVIDYENGEERIHIAQDAVPLLEYAPAPPEDRVPRAGSLSAPPPSDVPYAIGQDLNRLFAKLWARWLGMEAKLIAQAKAKGVTLTDGTVRAVCGGVALLVLVLLYEIL
jgi:hypothetical protein